MRRVLLVVGLVILAAGIQPISAIYVPQSRREFMNAVAAGGRGTKMEKITVDRNLAEIYSVLKKRSSPCLDVEVRRTGYVGYTERSLSDYNPTLKMVGKNKVEFALQVVHRPRAVGEVTAPGGLYIMAADLKWLGKNRTEVTLYRSSIGFKQITNSVRQWASGEDADCPKMK